jgi:hypothetical protein
MGLLSRIQKLALSLPIVLALFLVMATSQHHGPGRWMAATSAWAGSPDETLNPQPTLPGGRAAYSYGTRSDVPTVGVSAAAPMSLRYGRVTWIDRWMLVWRFYLTSRLRF